MESSPATINQLQQHQEEIGGGCACILLPAAIAAVIIASQYDAETSPCGAESAQYLIDLQLFLNIGGYIQIIYGCLHICVNCCAQGCSPEYRHNVTRSYQCPDCCLYIFYLVWAAFGLYMYNNQMSEECQSESIGIMVLAWSIIPYALIGVFLCVLGCFCCGVAAVFGATSAIKSTELASDQEAQNLV